MSKYNIKGKGQTPLDDYSTAVAIGQVAGVANNVKFGHCSAVAAATETDVWAYGATTPVYVFPNDEAVEAVSDAAGDTSVELTIQGLDDSGNLQEDVVTLNGTTAVAVTGLWKSVDRAFVSGSTASVGNLIVRDAATSTKVFAYAEIAEQQTTQAIWTVPLGKVAVINNYSTAMNTGGNQDTESLFTLKIQSDGGVFRTQIKYGLQKRGTSNISSDLANPVLAGPLSRVKVTAIPSAQMDISAEFSIRLLDSDLVCPDVLATL